MLKFILRGLVLGALLASPATAQQPGIPVGPALPPDTAPAVLPEPPAVVMPDSQSVELSLEEAARLALTNSPRLEVARARLAALRAEVEVVAAPARPQAELFLSEESAAEPQGPPVRATIDGVDVDFQVITGEVFARNRAILGLRQLLFDGGRVLARIDQARASADRSEQEAVAEWNRLYLEVGVAYLAVLEAESGVDVTREALEVARNAMRIAELRYQAGMVPRADVVFAQLPVERAGTALVEASHRFSSAREELNALLGMPLDTPLRLRPVADPPPVADGLEAHLKGALEARPELKAQRAALTAADHGIVAARRENNAQIHAVAEARAAGYNARVLNSPGYLVGVQMEWPFLDGNRTVHLTERARAQRAEAAALVRQAEATVQQDVRREYRLVEMAAVQYRSAHAEVQQAREALRIATRQYEVGMGALFPVREAQRDLVQAMQGRTRARFDYLRARARLEWARGSVPKVGK